MKYKKIAFLFVVLIAIVSMFLKISVVSAENVVFESNFDTAEERTKTFPIANGKTHTVTYEAGLGGKSNTDYAIKLTAQRTSTADTSSAELNPAFELPYFPYQTFSGDIPHTIEASVLYGGDVSSAKIDCYMNTTGSFSSGNKALYTFLEIKNGKVFVLGDDTGISCQKNEWLDFVIEEHSDVSQLRIFVNNHIIKTSLSGHSIYGNRWTQSKITFNESTIGTGYIAFDNVKIYEGNYSPELVCSDISLYVNGEETNNYNKKGDVLSAEVEAYSESAKEAMLAMVVHNKEGQLEAVYTDRKLIDGDAIYSVSHTLNNVDDIDVKVMFWNCENMKPYSKSKSFKSNQLSQQVYCNYMLNSENDFTFFTETGTKNGIEYMEEADEGQTNGFVRFTRNATDRFFAYVEPGRTENNIVISTDIRVNSSSPPMTFIIGDGLSESGTIFTTLTQISGGKISGKYPLNSSWNNISAVLNLSAKKADIYLNNNFLTSVYYDSSVNYVTQFRIQCYSSSIMGYFDVDNIRIYSGSEIVDIGDKTPIDFNRFDATDNGQMYLNGKRAVQTYSNTAYDGDEKIRLAKDCINYGDEVLLDEQTFSMLFNKTVSVNGSKITISDGTVMNVGSYILTKSNTSTRKLTVPPEKHDGIVYIPAVAYGNATMSSSSFVDDGHGMLICGSGLDKTDARMKKANLYLFFDRKSPNELKNQLCLNTDDLTVHPRLMLKQEDVARLKAECVTKSTRDSYKYAWYKQIKSEADALMTAEPYTYRLSGGRLNAIASSISRRLEVLSFMYLMTNQRAYANRAIEELEAITKFPDWGEQGSFLDTSTIAVGAAIAYDWLYNYMSEEQREYFALKIQEYSVRLARQAYECEATFNDFFWNTETNWGIITNGSIANAIFATAEYNTDECMVTLNYALRAIESTWYRFAPDGAWYEGPGYWSYMFEYLAKFMACYESSMGEGFAENYRGLDKYGYFQCYFMGPDGLPNNFHDSDLYNIQSEGQFLFARIFGDENLMRYRREQLIKSDDVFPSVEDILWYDTSVSDDDTGIELDNVSYFRETEFVSIRESWNNSDSAWLSFHGGRLDGAHDHIDAGTFVYCIGGERWAIDLGKEPLRYTNPDPASQAGYTIQNYYRARAEGHNSVVISPSEALGMTIGSNSKVSSPVVKDNCIFSTVDLSNAYSSSASSYIRGFKMTDNLRTLTIRDEITLKSAAPLYWFMHTEGTISIVNNNTALITKGEKTLKVQIESNVNHTLSVQNAEPLPTSPSFEMTPNTGVTKLTFKADNASGAVHITVKLSLIDEIGSDSGVDTTQISGW